MAKLVKLLIYSFAFIGVLVTAGGGYVYATNSELVGEFIAVKDDFRNVAPERRKEVFAELPARVKFENEVGKEMAELPAERQKDLYEQLAKSRDTLFASFKERITQEAKIMRETKNVGDAVKEIASKLGKIEVSVDLAGGKKSSVAPKADDKLTAVNAAHDKVMDAGAAYGDAKDTNNKQKIVAAAVGVLKALDKLGDEVVKARKTSLSSNDKDKLTRLVGDAKSRLYDIKQTPGLSEDATAKPLFESIPKKLNG